VNEDRCRYAEEADPEEIESEAPQLVPLTTGEEADNATTGISNKKPLAASEGTPLLADRAGEQAHQPVGDAPRGAEGGDRGEVSTLDGDDFVDLGDNAIISELEPERWDNDKTAFSRLSSRHRQPVCLKAA